MPEATSEQVGLHAKNIYSDSLILGQAKNRCLRDLSDRCPMGVVATAAPQAQQTWQTAHLSPLGWTASPYQNASRATGPDGNKRSCWNSDFGTRSATVAPHAEQRNGLFSSTQFNLPHFLHLKIMGKGIQAILKDSGDEERFAEWITLSLDPGRRIEHIAKIRKLALDLTHFENHRTADIDAGLELGTQAILSLVVVRPIAQKIAELKVGAKTTCVPYPFVNVLGLIDIQVGTTKGGYANRSGWPSDMN